ncbi:MAG: LLM class flavin-dependent oxidoreductase [Aigarchaeota archaeon]|nr:LLM class flavin-dependent oxidoreductase [Aigarchaeota archaeon]MDW8092477.1 LLM class flavin-dependent oxidoreductase [Nitrososphaerota archaeon]
MTKVKFGFTVPNRLPLFHDYSALELVNLVKKVDEMNGFHSTWVGDNLLTKPRLESISVLSALAVSTKRLKLGTACMASFTLRDPILLATQWATLDVLSSGRTILGVCIGGAIAGGEISAEKEFLAFGRQIKHRVSLMTEGVEVLRKLWTGEPVSYEGKHYRLDRIRVLPKPVQNPVPIWVAVTPRPETAETTNRRVAKYFDGWMTTKVYPPQFAEHWDAIRRYASEYNRRIEENLLYYNLNINDNREAAFREAKTFLDGYYMMDFSKPGIDIWSAYGPPHECIKRLDEYVSAGAKGITIRFASFDQLGQLRRFEREVLPSF